MTPRSSSRRSRINLTSISFGGLRKRRQFAYITRIVLDDDGCVQVGGELLEALDRRNRRGAIVVVPWHAIGVPVLAEMRGVAGQDQASRRELHQQAVVAGRVPRRRQHDYAAVAEDVSVGRHRLDLAVALGPRLER